LYLLMPCVSQFVFRCSKIIMLQFIHVTSLVVHTWRVFRLNIQQMPSPWLSAYPMNKHPFARFSSFARIFCASWTIPTSPKVRRWFTYGASFLYDQIQPWLNRGLFWNCLDIMVCTSHHDLPPECLRLSFNLLSLCLYVSHIDDMATTRESSHHRVQGFFYCSWFSS